LWRITPSAVGERQMLPMQTNSTLDWFNSDPGAACPRASAIRVGSMRDNHRKRMMARLSRIDAGPA
jgi:hypothetical protein